jgi:hypothetical protein
LQYAKASLSAKGFIVDNTVKPKCEHLQWSQEICLDCGAHVKTIMLPFAAKPILANWNPKVETAMKNGDIRPLPRSSSPMWTSQWAVRGAFAVPYVVSRKSHQEQYNGSTTESGWACSCPNFTQHSPRTECKHILKVMLLIGTKPSAPPVASLPDDQQAAFQKFLRQQAERGTPALPTGKGKPLFTQGRRFR